MRSIVKFLSVTLHALVAAFPAKEMWNDAICFPEVEENFIIRNKQGRQPIYAPSMCPENELLYPGDQKDDWICDCWPAYIYHTKTDKCWAAWRRGPCAAGEYLTLPPASVIPVCERNGCQQDGHVTWRGACRRLGAPEPCAHLYPAAAVLGVNATTLHVGCVLLSFETRVAEHPAGCPPGGKRRVDGKCAPMT